jgi:putative acetyltransferase
MAMELTVRHAEPDDFDAVREIYSLPRAIAGTLQVPFASAEIWRKRLAEPRAHFRELVAVTDGTPVGHLGLDASFRARRAHVATLGMAVRDDFQHRGVGSFLLGAAISLADNWLGILRIELNVFTDNEAALRLYRKFGFVVEGTHRAFALRDGVYVDTFSMARLHPSPPRLPERDAQADPS